MDTNQTQPNKPHEFESTDSLAVPKMKRVSPLSSLASFPANICIDGQNPNEYVLLFVREHKIILVINIFLYAIIMFLPQILRWLVGSLDQNIFGSYLHTQTFFGSNWWIVINIAWFSYILTGYFNIFFRWFYNINLLTTERFMDIDFEGIFSNRIETASIKDVEDAKDTQVGLLQSLFNMGDITILTASGGTIFNLDNVPKAHKIRDFIMDVKIKFDKERGYEGND